MNETSEVSQALPEAGLSRPGRFLTGLLTYFAAVQGLHLLGLATESASMALTGEMRIFAPPPARGWNQAELVVLMVTGAVDAVVAVATLVSLRPARRGETAALARMTAAVTAALYSACVFAAVTIPAGVWADHAVYWIEALIFAPFPLALWALLRFWGAKKD